MGLRSRFKKVVGGVTNVVSYTTGVIQTGVNIGVNYAVNPISTVKNAYEYMYTMARVVSGQVPEQEANYEEIEAVPRIMSFEKDLSPVNSYYFSSMKKINYSTVSDPIFMTLINKISPKVLSEIELSKPGEKVEKLSYNDLVKVDFLDRDIYDTTQRSFTFRQIMNLIKELGGESVEIGAYTIMDSSMAFCQWPPDLQTKLQISGTQTTNYSTTPIVNINNYAIGGLKVGWYSLQCDCSFLDILPPIIDAGGRYDYRIEGLLKKINFWRYESKPRLN